MKALVYSGPEHLIFQDSKDPIPTQGEVIVKVNSVGICGSDMHAYLGHDERRPAPLILGHEVSGTVLEGKYEGQRVTINPLVSCGSCAFCLSGRDNLCVSREIISMPPRQGGFAEYIVIPVSNLVEVPDEITLEQASLAEPIACGWHAVRISLPKIEKDNLDIYALVIGGGAIGVGAALSLQCMGVENISIVESNELRRKYLAHKTAFDIRDPQIEKSVGEYDIVVDAVGLVQTRELASQAVHPGGTIVHIGLGAAEGGLDIRRMTLQEITFIGTYTYTADDFRNAAAAMFQGHLGRLDWFEERPLSAGAQAFTDIRNGAVQTAKLILKP